MDQDSFILRQVKHVYFLIILIKLAVQKDEFIFKLSFGDESCIIVILKATIKAV